MRGAPHCDQEDAECWHAPGVSLKPVTCVVSDFTMGSCFNHRVAEGQLLLFDLLRKQTLVNIFPLCEERCPFSLSTEFSKGSFYFFKLEIPSSLVLALDLESGSSPHRLYLGLSRSASPRACIPFLVFSWREFPRKLSVSSLPTLG